MHINGDGILNMHINRDIHINGDDVVQMHINRDMYIDKDIHIDGEDAFTQSFNRSSGFAQFLTQKMRGCLTNIGVYGGRVREDWFKKTHNHEARFSLQMKSYISPAKPNEHNIFENKMTVK